MAHSWSEEWLRKVASWQAVKQGRHWLDSGAVSLAEADASSCRGRVGKGRGARGVLVRVLGPHDVEARCGCQENAATGAVCSHAAALILAVAWGAKSGAASPAMEKDGADAAAGSGKEPGAGVKDVPALAVEFPPGWLNGLERGKLCARVSKLRDGADVGGESDRRLAATWLRGIRGTEAILRPDDARAGEFLADLAGHPRVTGAAGKKGERAEIEVLAAGVRIPAQVDFDPDADALSIRWTPAEQKNDRLMAFGGIPWLWASAEHRLASPGVALSQWGADEWSALAAGKPVSVPLDDAAPALESFREIFAPAPGSWLNEVRLVRIAPRIRLELEGSHRSLDARVLACYPDADPAPIALAVPGPDGRAGESSAAKGNHLGWDEGRTRLLCRDPMAEQAALKRLFDAGFLPHGEPGSWRLAGENEIAAFVAGILPQCRADQWKISEGPRWQDTAKRFLVVHAEIETLPSGYPDSVAFRIRYLVGGNKENRENEAVEEIPADQIRRLLATKRTRITRRDGRVVVLPESELLTIERSFEALAPTQESGRYTADSVFEPWLHELRENLRKGVGFKSDTTQTAEFDGLVSRDRLNRLFQADDFTLRDYQCSGIDWLLDRVSRWGAALLADDMGLGKTVQVLSLLRLLKEEGMEGATLVVCPTSVIGHWREELEKFWPGCRVEVLHGSRRDEAFARVENGDCDVALTSYGTLERDRALHLRRRYGAVVLDEASFIRNPATDAARSVCKLDAGIRLALTGTPIENGVGDLWSIFRFLRPGYLGSRADFKRRYEEPMKGAKGGESPDLSRLAELRVRVSPLILRRTKERVASELPPRIGVDEWCELNPGQRKLYESILREHHRRSLGRRGGDAAERMEMLTVLLRLRQVCCDPGLLDDSSAQEKRPLEALGSAKVERCAELVREAVLEGRKVLIFSQFAKMLRRLRERLSEGLGIDSALLCGATSDREAEIARFKRPDGPPVFLISLKAGGYGLNLTEADVVIHFDPWWNPAAEAQATDRAHRIGQTNPVNVYRLLTTGTVEAHVLKLQEQKRGLVGATLDENALGQARGIDTRELEGLLEMKK